MLLIQNNVNLDPIGMIRIRILISFPSLLREKDLVDEMNFISQYEHLKIQKTGSGFTLHGYITKWWLLARIRGVNVSLSCLFHI